MTTETETTELDEKVDGVLAGIGLTVDDVTPSQLETLRSTLAVRLPTADDWLRGEVRAKQRHGDDLMRRLYERNAR